MANEFKVKKGLIVQGSGSTVLDIQGSLGQLFSVTDSLSGSLFSVNDMSGTPIMEVFSDNIINLGTFGAEAIKISGSTANITGSITNAISASYLADGVVSGSSQVILTSTNGYSTFSSSIATTTLNLSDRIGTLETSSISLNNYTSSIKTALEFTGSNVTVKGNLMVKGTTTTVDSTTVEIGDNIISLNGSGATNAGIIVRDATSPNLISGSLLWDTTTDKWIAGPAGSEDDIILSTKEQTIKNKTIDGMYNTITNIGNSTTATNLASGSAGTIPYQTSAGTTAMLAAGTSGYFLKSNNTSAPSWVELSLTDLPDAWVKKSVKVATTTNITLSGTTTIDGVAVVAGDRVLVKNQTTTSQNGIYIVNSSTWTRSTDADTISKLAGTVVNVDSGTSNGGLKFITKLKTTDTLGTTAVNFYKVTDETDLNNLVPYTGANKDVNIASNYFKTSKGFELTKDLDNYFIAYYYTDYNVLEFSSKDISSDNFGEVRFRVNPDEGFVFQKYNDTGSNTFQVTTDSTYSKKLFVSDEGFKITDGTPNQALTANGGVFDLNTIHVYTEVTKSELDVLISENKLEPNRIYKITGVESWCFSQHLIKAIYLKAITNNTLESEGVGEFYTPKYNTSDSNLGIWKGELLTNGMISSASYNIGDKVIWGNLFWENISGNIGSNEMESITLGSIKVDSYLSEEDWQLITPNDDVSLYNIQFNSIKYDVGNDYINYRADDLGNVYEINYNSLLNYDLSHGDEPILMYYLNAISLFQWGRSSTYKNIIKNSLVSNCNYNTKRFYNNTVEDTRIVENNFLNVDIIGNNFKSASVDRNYLKHFGGIIENNLDNSNISLNRYYFQISKNTLKNYSNILNNNDNNIIVNGRYTSITSNNLDNNSFISSNTFVEEGKGVSGYKKGIYDNVLTTYCNINSNTIKNGSRIFGHRLEYYSTINGNTLDADSNIYNNQLIQNGKIDNNILTGHGRIYGNQLDRLSEITNCKLRIYPATSYATTMKNNRLFAGKIQNVDFGDIVNPVGSDPNNPAFGGNALSECIIENESIIKDLTFPNNGGIGIQFVKMNGYSEFKNITVNNPIRNVDFINTIFNETSDYSKLIQGSGHQTNGFTKTYIDGVLLQDRLDVPTNPITGTTNYIPKFLSGGTIGNSLIYDNGTSVGIGTTSPSSYKLNVNGDTNINGTLTATVKSFIIDHPTKSNKKLQYGVLEGPEHSVYFRGKLKGTNKIILPDYWFALVNEETITVNITPIGDKQNIWVVSTNACEIILESETEINCFYTVFAERKDIDKLVTEFDK